LSGSPDNIGLDFESLFFVTADGVKIHAWYIPKENARGTVLFCHGNGGNISGRLDTIRILNYLGFATFIFDYRGYGISEGSPSEAGTFRDAMAAYDFIQNRLSLKPEDIIIFGRSLGGAVAANLAIRRSHRVLILESTFTSIGAIARQYYPMFPVRLISRIKYNTLACVKEISTPLLLIHSTEDGTIPFSHSENLYEAASQPKVLLRISGDHNDGFLRSGAYYIEGIDKFLKDN